MSEVSDAVQIIIVSGKGGYMVGKLTVKTALFIGKVINSIYLAKWHGRASVNRLRHIKGEDFSFINIGTEDKKILKAIEKEMKSHGLLFAQLPDLCGGDGRTQYIVPTSAAANLRAFLLDHANGKHKEIKAGLISPSDYVQSGVDRGGRPNREMTELLQTVPRIEQQEQFLIEDKQRFLPEIAYNVRKHDIDVDQRGQTVWIQANPIKKHTSWGMYQMPDGIHAVIIPKEDMLDGYSLQGAGKVMPPLAAVCPGKSYIIVNLKDGHMEQAMGSDVVTRFKKESIWDENRNMRIKGNVKSNKDIIQVPVQNQAENQIPKAYTRVTIHEKMFENMEADGFYYTRIPYKKEVVAIPKSDCKIYKTKSGIAIMSAYVYHDTSYQIRTENGETYSIHGLNLRQSYDDKTKKQNGLNQRVQKTSSHMKGKGVKKRNARNPKSKP